MINVFKGKSKSKHSFLALCLPCFSSHRLVKETGLAMNRWTEQTAMLSSLISEKTVKKGGTFLSHSHPLSSICSFYPCPSIIQSGGADKAINDIPLHVQVPSSSPIFFLLFSSLIFLVPFIPGNYADMHLSSSTSIPIFTPIRHQHSSIWTTLLCCHFMFDKTI